MKKDMWVASLNNASNEDRPCNPQGMIATSSPANAGIDDSSVH